MTGPHPDTREPATRPISVAELLARNGNVGSPPAAGRRRRRRSNSDAVTVAELTGEIPVIRDSDQEPDRDPPAVSDEPAEESVDQPEPVKTAGWAEPGPRWPKSAPQSLHTSGPEHSNYPRPVRRTDSSDAEQMSPDPVDSYAGVAVDIDADGVDADVADAEPLIEDADETSSGTGTRRKILSWRRLRAAKAGEAGEAGEAGADAVGRPPEPQSPTDLDDDHADIEADLAGEPEPQRSLWSELLGGGLIVLQSMLAVLLGAGLFIAFDQLWHWNNIVALVLTVLVTLGLVAAVQAVRRTVDIGSTLIAVAVGLLITLGPLALHAN